MTSLTRYAATIAALAKPRVLRAQSPAAQEVVHAFRLCALAARDRTDPLPALALRLCNCEAAYVVHDLVRAVAQAWPEPFVVGSRVLPASFAGRSNGDPAHRGRVRQGPVGVRRCDWRACPARPP